MPHIDSRRRAEEALTLRAQAYTWAEISDRLGFRSREGSRLAVRRLLLSTRMPTVGELRSEHREALRVFRRRQLDHLAEAEANGETELATKIMRELRANIEAAGRLDGVNAPQRTEVNVTVSRSASELIDAVRAELAALPRRQRLGPATIDAEVISEEATA